MNHTIRRLRFRIRYQYGRLQLRVHRANIELWRFIAWLIAPILWAFPSQRDSYYEYRERCWRSATTAVSWEEYVYQRLTGRTKP